MEWLWTWGGTSFGYRDGNNLWTHDGKHVGRFHEDEVYRQDGSYLGELLNGRLVTHLSKQSRRRSPFVLYGSRIGYLNRIDYVGHMMLAGYEDFPA